MFSLLLCFVIFLEDLLPLQQHTVKGLRNITKNGQRVYWKSIMEFYYKYQFGKLERGG